LETTPCCLLNNRFCMQVFSKWYKLAGFEAIETGGGQEWRDDPGGDRPDTHCAARRWPRTSNP
jgi:hypothetical protein